jgi:hypothetical protein
MEYSESETLIATLQDQVLCRAKAPEEVTTSI